MDHELLDRIIEILEPLSGDRLVVNTVRAHILLALVTSVVLVICTVIYNKSQRDNNSERDKANGKISEELG